MTWANKSSSTKRSYRDIKHITLSLTSANFPIVGARTRNKLHPGNIVDAQFSAYFQTANAWLYGSNTGAETYTRLADPEIHDLCDKITYLPVAHLKEMGSSITVEYADGTVNETHMPAPLGEVSHPFTKDQVELKFFGLATPVYGEKKAKRIRDMVENIEKHLVTELLELLQ